jgi:hypothetical protein
MARDIRKRNGNRPLLLLFPIAPSVADGAEDLDLSKIAGLHVWGWTISMPGSKTNHERIVVLANTVYRREMEELLEFDYQNEETDDDN